ncbi:hypothetical protein ACO0LG_14730 [Undibacterium sp. Ji42W]|uniref:hypothetical protein n=1 Tax=Undibacterium sp. Ji42W TaxID=3413039 RepID=UPI003BF3D8D5
MHCLREIESKALLDLLVAYSAIERWLNKLSKQALPALATTSMMRAVPTLISMFTLERTAIAVRSGSDPHT